jgi:D-aminopeptidase
VAVKDGIGTTAALSMHPFAARELIRSRVKDAITQRHATAHSCPPGVVPLTVELVRASQADLAMKIPGMKRESARVVAYRAPDMTAAHMVIDLIVLLASTDRL